MSKDADVDRLTFEAWLRTVCFQAPTPEAHDLAKCAWEAGQSLSQEAVRDEVLEGVLATAEGTFVPAVILDGKRLPDEYGDWRALPRHPTWQMKEAGGEAYLQSKELEGQNTGLTAMHMAEGIYHAMWKTPEVGLPSALKRESNAAVVVGPTCPANICLTPKGCALYGCKLEPYRPGASDE